MSSKTKSKSVNNTDVSELMQDAVAKHQAGNLDEAATLYKSALKQNSNHVDALHLLGVIYNQQNKFDKAIEQIKKAIRLDPKQPAFYQNIGNAYLNKQDLNKTIECYEKAVHLNPELHDLKFVLANLYKALNIYDKAENYYIELIKLMPSSEDLLTSITDLYNIIGEYHKAIEISQTSLKLIPNSIGLLINIGNSYYGTNDYANAEKSFKQVLDANPNHEIAYFNLANTYREQNKVEDAIEAYKKAIELKPDWSTPYNNLANLYTAINREADAEALLNNATEKLPGDANSLYNLANIYLNNGDYNKTIETLVKTIDLCKKALHQSDELEFKAHNNLGIAYKELNQLKNASASFKQALKIKPNDLDAKFNLAMVLFELKNYKAAIQNLEDIDEEFPEHKFAKAKLYYAYAQVCDFDNIDKVADEITVDTGDTPYLSVLRKASPTDNLSVAKHWSDIISAEARTTNLKFDFSGLKNSKPRIGYLSSDFHNHATMHLMQDLFKAHNKSEFEIINFSYGVEDDSEYRKIAKNDSDEFYDLRDMSFTQMAEFIYNKKIDILVDLKGYSQGSRIQALALKPAPTIVNYLGFPGSCGSDFHDYIIADNYLIKNSDTQNYTEQVINLNSCYQVNSKQHIADKNYTKKELGLPDNKIVFCCFNQAAKITRKYFNLWMDILNEVPDSVLWILAPDKILQQNLINYAKIKKIDKSRLIFAGNLAKHKHLARIKHADIALDTEIYNGHTTTSDMLYSGVPVITATGCHFASRVSGSILSHFGLPELIAENTNKYKCVAVELAKDKAKLANLKSKIKQQTADTNFYDGKKYATELEQAYKSMLEQYKAKS